MNELLQKHGCCNVFTIPEGLKELMGDISREVLREQPVKVCEFIANYLSALMITREHGILAVKLLEDLCDCKPSVSEHLLHIGMCRDEANDLSDIIKKEVERGAHTPLGKEKVQEQEIMRQILSKYPLDEETAAQVCEITRNCYRDYWYRRKLLQHTLKVKPDEPWEIAVQHTLEIYKKTKPSITELDRATLKIQAAYKGYHLRRRMLGHLKPKEPKEPDVNLSGPPIDIAESREIDLGRVVILCCLSFLATGSYQNIVGKSLFNYVSQPSASRAIRTVVNALNHPNIIKKYIRFPQNITEREALKQSFFDKFKIPGVIGCVDGTLVAMIRPKVQEDRYYCRKGYHARNVLIDIKNKVKVDRNVDQMIKKAKPASHGTRYDVCTPAVYVSQTAPRRTSFARDQQVFVMQTVPTTAPIHDVPRLEEVDKIYQEESSDGSIDDRKLSFHTGLNHDFEILEDVPDVPNGVPEDLTDDIPNDITEDIPNDVTDDIPNDVTDDIHNDVTDDIPNDVSEEIAENLIADLSSAPTSVATSSPATTAPPSDDEEPVDIASDTEYAVE